MKVLTCDLSERKRILSALCKKNTKYNVLIAISLFLRIIACLVLVAGLIYTFYDFHTEGLILIPLSVVAFIIPFVCGTSVKNSAKYKYAYPLSSYANGTLMLKESSLEYAYWSVSKREPAAYSSKNAVYDDEDKYVYSISKENIDSISFEDGICYIQGEAVIKLPQWVHDIERSKKGDWKVNDFKFALAFSESDSENLIKNWRN